MHREVKMSEDDIRKKNSFLYVIHHDTSVIKDKLVRLKNIIDKNIKMIQTEWGYVKNIPSLK